MSVEFSEAKTASSDRSVRAALPTDAAAISRIHLNAMRALAEEAGATDAGLQMPDEAVLTARWMRTLSEPRPQGCHTLVAVHGHVVVGFLSCAPGEPITGGAASHVPAGTDILNLWVDGPFRRCGHASRLLAALVDVAQPAALRFFAPASSDEHTRFLRSAGFGPAGIRRTLRLGATHTLAEHLWWALLD